MAKPVITVAVDSKGGVQVSTKCIEGAACRQISASMEAALGVATDEELTPEFYQNPPEKVRVSNG